MRPVVAWEEIHIEVVVAFGTKWMLHLTIMVMMTTMTVGGLVSYDCTRKLIENDKLKVLKSKLKSHSDNQGTFMVTLKKSYFL